MLIEINGGSEVKAVEFAANGEYLLSGGKFGSVRVWGVEDGIQMATMEVGVLCLAVSSGDRVWRRVCAERKDIRKSLLAQGG